MKRTFLLLVMAAVCCGLRLQAADYYTATASTNMGAYQTYVIGNVVDGDMSTKFWSDGAQTAGQYIVLDLAETKDLGTIELFFAENDQPTSAKIAVSADNASYTDIATFATADIVSNQYVCDGTRYSARYVKMELTAGNSNWFQLYEFRVGVSQAPAPSRTISVSVNDETMGRAYIDSEGTQTKTAEGPIDITAVANDGYVFVNWTLDNGAFAATSAVWRDNTEGDKNYVALFSLPMPADYCELSSRINEGCGSFNYDNVHSHGIRSMEISVDGNTVISLGEATSTFNYLQDTERFAVKPGQTIRFDFTTGRWTRNMWIGCDWDRDGVFEEIHVLYEDGIPTEEQQTNDNLTGTYSLTVPQTAAAGLSRMRIISDGQTCESTWPTDYTDVNLLCGTQGDGTIGYAGSVHDVGVAVIVDKGSTTGCRPVSVGEAAIAAAPNGISVKTSVATDLTVFTLTGSVICTKTVNGEEFVRVPAGIYAVRAGNRVCKVVVK